MQKNATKNRREKYTVTNVCQVNRNKLTEIDAWPNSANFPFSPISLVCRTFPINKVRLQTAQHRHKGTGHTVLSYLHIMYM